MFHRIVLPTLLCSAFLLSISAVAQNELVPAPNAVELRRVWTQEGTHLAADEYGYNVWGGVDLTGDSIADFAVHRRVDNTWLFYAGGDPPSTEPFWSMDSVGSVPPYIGDFWGDGRKHMLFRDGYEEIIDGYSYLYDRLRLFEVLPEGVRSEATVTVDQGAKEPPIERYLREVFVFDMNKDATDEVIVSLGGLRIGQVRTADLTRQVWFYMGGEEFQLDSPTVVVRDTSQYGTPDNWEVRFADFDGDGRIDMAMGGSYPTGGSMLRFYWGDENSPWSWATRPPDYDVQLTSGETGITGINGMGIYDLNGDGAADIGATIGSGDEAIGRLYLSGRGKDPRKRTYTIEDADWTINKTVVSSARLGYLNDSTDRYEMLRLGGTVEGNQIATFGMTATDNGLDYDYEAWYAPGLDGLRNESLSYRSGPIGDVTGDGYEDVIFASRFWQSGVSLNAGIAIVLAGGPYIPFDDPSMSVAEYPVAGESGGLYLWPNPVVDELHIAWKGNLQRMPTRFAVFDLQGKEVVSGDVESYRGSALWRCASVAAGTYMVTLSDTAGEVIATVPIVKE